MAVAWAADVGRNTWRRCCGWVSPSQFRWTIRGLAAVAMVVVAMWYVVGQFHKAAVLDTRQRKIAERQLRIYNDQQQLKGDQENFRNSVVASLAQILLITQHAQDAAVAAGQTPAITREQVTKVLENSFTPEQVREAERRAGISPRPGAPGGSGPTGPQGPAGPPGTSPPTTNPPPATTTTTRPPPPPPAPPEKDCFLGLHLPILDVCAL